MSAPYVVPEWMEAVRGKTLFYPAAGSDYCEALTVFQNYIDTFWFCDIGYPAGLDLPSAFDSNTSFRLIQSWTSGATNAASEIRADETCRTYRFLYPSRLMEIYERADGRRLTVVRRRGFGQIALSTEIAERSLGVFMYRGDSPSESGSNIYFLSNKKTNYVPCGNLFDKIDRYLTDRALDYFRWLQHINTPSAPILFEKTCKWSRRVCLPRNRAAMKPEGPNRYRPVTPRLQFSCSIAVSTSARP